MIKRLVLVVFALATLAMAGMGCRTAHGAGEDLENAGESIQRNTSP